MARQKHDIGEKKRITGTKPFSKEKLWRERRKRNIPYLYPGWDEDRRSLREVKETLRERRLRALR